MLVPHVGHGMDPAVLRSRMLTLSALHEQAGDEVQRLGPAHRADPGGRRPRVGAAGPAGPRTREG